MKPQLISLKSGTFHIEARANQADTLHTEYLSTQKELESVRVENERLRKTNDRLSNENESLAQKLADKHKQLEKAKDDQITLEDKMRVLQQSSDEATRKQVNMQVSLVSMSHAQIHSPSNFIHRPYWELAIKHPLNPCKNQIKN